MKTVYPLFILSFMVLCLPALAQTNHTVEVGGGGVNGTPFYDPQFITINQGDMVTWEFVSGTHTVTTTSAPENFNSGLMSAPATFEFTFDTPGEYEYECTVGNHAQFQFGTITVEPAKSIAESGENKAMAIYPNPASDNLSVKGLPIGTVLTLLDLNGRMIHSLQVTDSVSAFDVSGLENGIYFMNAVIDGDSRTRKLIISK